MRYQYESHNDRNDRAILAAASYLKKQRPTKVITLCTNDQAFDELAKKQGVPVRSFKRTSNY